MEEAGRRRFVQAGKQGNRDFPYPIPARLLGEGQERQLERFELSDGQVPRTLQLNTNDVASDPSRYGNVDFWLVVRQVHGVAGVGLCLLQRLQPASK